MKKGYFITGTGTDVGKTVATAGILKTLIKNGIKAAPMKPIQSGGIKSGDHLEAPDLKFCLDTIALRPDRAELALMNPYCYEPACSPHLAARMADNYPDYDKIMDSAESLFDKYDVVLVEGAGGIMVPLDDEGVTNLDLMEAFQFPVILVADAGLGTINHTLLTINAIVDAGLEIAGVLLVNTTPVANDAFIREDNANVIENMGGEIMMGNIRYLENLAPDNDAAWTLFGEDFKGLDILTEELDK